MKVFGRQARPRILLLGLNDTEVGELQNRFPTTRVINELGEVEPAEWDVLVTRRDVWRAADHLYIIAARADGTARFGLCHVDGAHAVWIEYGGTSFAEEFNVPDSIPEELRGLVEGILVPKLRTERQHHILRPSSSYPPALSMVDLRPLIATSTGECLAGMFRRRGNLADCWCLPDLLENLAPWVSAAVDVWRAERPELFPEQDQWKRAPEWHTPEEAIVAEKLARLRRERDEYLQGVVAQESQLESEMASANMAGDDGARGVLTEQGDELVRRVGRLLIDLGLGIEFMDDKWPPGDRREDLRLSTADSDWRAIVEVRGYKRGAALVDLQRLGRFRARYVRDEGVEPDAMWYIVNQFVGQNPGERPAALASNPDDVDEFSLLGGLIIDTVELFRLWRRVVVEGLAMEEARSALVAGAGVFTEKSVG